jgi:hypothetical protein
MINETPTAAPAAEANRAAGTRRHRRMSRATTVRRTGGIHRHRRTRAAALRLAALRG